MTALACGAAAEAAEEALAYVSARWETWYLGGIWLAALALAALADLADAARLRGDETAVEAVTTQNDISSAHITFIDEAGARECERRNWLIRHGVQYHWFNRGYSSFEDFLASLTSRRRKAIRKERAQACDGLRFEILRGDQIGPAEWDSMWAFYQDTGSRKWGRPYLTRAAFDLFH